MVCVNIENPEADKNIFRVVSASVAQRLTGEEIHEAFTQLHEKMKTRDPDNPDLWVIEINDRKLWGILDRKAGASGEDVLTILFPEDY